MNTGPGRSTVYSYDDSHVETRGRSIQKSMKDIPKQLLPAWGERWPTTPRPRRRSDNALEDKKVVKFHFEQGLSEFQLDLSSTSALDKRDSSSARAAHPHRSKSGPALTRTRSKRQRDERWAPYTVTPSPQAQSSSCSAGCKRARLEAPSCSPDPSFPPLQETVVPSPIYGASAVFDDGPFIPTAPLYCYSQDHDGQYRLNLHNARHIDCGASSSSLEQSDTQLLSPASCDVTNTAFSQFQGLRPYDSTSWWAAGYETNETNFWPSTSVTPHYNYGPGANQYYMNDMDPGTFPTHSQPSDPFAF